ncbi:molybdate ABC transporter substrate-binding protein [Gracilibacillus sp. YIM 98692]|uniref:molybdate ABC transporter substrate-binding protein n=1 Tax=Gracilibacillus sp. YIM 98692 TaxID=2663532 RepID=UPI0013CFEBB2|nr:molybdate ABC transporter substrate-binding protein [Gracilibacillus sp. YIM 98692]
MIRNILSILTFCLLISGCQSNQTELTISAAASLEKPLSQIIQQYENKHPNIHISTNFSGSGTLSQQIIQGAPVDLFFSASLEKYQRVIDAGRIEQPSSVPLLTNELVWIQPKNTAIITDYSQITQMAIGTPEAVPAGAYAKEALASLGVFTSLEEHLVLTKDVRQVLQYVESGNVDAGIVYYSDAVSSDQVQINRSFALGEHRPIIYPVGIVNDTKYQAEIETFLEFLQTDTAIDIFEDNGFQEIDGEDDGSFFTTN